MKLLALTLLTLVAAVPAPTPEEAALELAARDVPLHDLPVPGPSGGYCPVIQCIRAPCRSRCCELGLSYALLNPIHPASPTAWLQIQRVQS